MYAHIYVCMYECVYVYKYNKDNFIYNFYNAKQNDNQREIERQRCCTNGMTETIILQCKNEFKYNATNN